MVPAAVDTAKGHFFTFPNVSRAKVACCVGCLLIFPVTPEQSSNKSLSATSSLNVEDSSLCAHLGTFFFPLLGGWTGEKIDLLIKSTLQGVKGAWHLSTWSNSRVVILAAETSQLTQAKSLNLFASGFLIWKKRTLFHSMRGKCTDSLSYLMKFGRWGVDPKWLLCCTPLWGNGSQSLHLHWCQRKGHEAGWAQGSRIRGSEKANWKIRSHWWHILSRTGTHWLSQDTDTCQWSPMCWNAGHITPMYQRDALHTIYPVPLNYILLRACFCCLS